MREAPKPAEPRKEFIPQSTIQPSPPPASDPVPPSVDGVTLQRIVGGKLVALKPDESIESFQSNRPSPTFTGFLEHLRRDSALGVIPFEFAADSSKIGGAGVRLIVAKADRRFSFRQMILERRLIKPVWTYVIGDAKPNRTEQTWKWVSRHSATISANLVQTLVRRSNGVLLTRS